MMAVVVKVLQLIGYSAMMIAGTVAVAVTLIVAVVAAAAAADDANGCGPVWNLKRMTMKLVMLAMINWMRLKLNVDHSGGDVFSTDVVDPAPNGGGDDGGGGVSKVLMCLSLENSYWDL